LDIRVLCSLTGGRYVDECGCPGDVPGAVKTAVLFKKRKKSFSFFFSHLFAGKLREYRERERDD
jgi:hypothetical protein